MTIPLIETKHLKKYFKTPQGDLHAVDDINIKINNGNSLGVVGESGCGKSTLGRTVLRLLEPTEGQVLYNGDNIMLYDKGKMRDMRKSMQIIFQDPYASLNPRLTLSEIISEPLVVNKIYKNRNQVTGRVKELMDKVGLSQRLINSYPHELDGGRRQRIGVARALALKPKFIVCDEPVSALDVSIQAQILNLMQDLQEEKKIAYMFITHDLSVVRHMSDEIIVMYLGVVVEKCLAEKLFKRQFHPYTKALLSAIPNPDIDVKKNRIILKDEIASPIDPGLECRFAARCNYATEKCFKETPYLRSIEDYHFVACHYAESL